MTREIAEDEQSVLLEQVRTNAVRLLTDVGRTPRNLRVRAGDIAVEIEWHETGQAGQTGEAGRAGQAGEDVPTPAVAAPEETGEYLTAPTVGVFYRAPAPGADPFVREGDVVSPGQQIGIVEAMKLMIPVEADRAGRITEVLISDGEQVEYAQRLFALAGE